MHARQQIRDAVVTALSGTVLATINPGRAFIVQTGELPVVNIYTASESDSLDEDGAVMGSPVIMRLLELVAEIRVITADGNAGQNALDDLAESVEDTMPRYPAGAMDVMPQSLEVEQTSEADGDQIISTGVLTFLCMYRTPVGDAGTIV